MRKSHWEYWVKKGSRDLCRNIGTKIIIRGATGVLHEEALLRRLLIQKEDQGFDWEDLPEHISMALPDNELIGDNCPEIMTSERWLSLGILARFSIFARHEKIYKVAREFGEMLSKVDLDIKAKLIPAFNFTFLVEFPENLRFHDPRNNDYFHCVYISVQKAGPGFQPVDREGNDVYCVAKLILPCYDENGREKDQENTLGLNFLDPDEDIAESLKRAERSSTHPISAPDCIRFILKTLIYLDSGDPDLREYRAPKPKTENPKKIKRWVKEHENMSLVDMTLIGFNWKKPRTYNVGETTVTGHPRWQPWGPGRTKVKLIWIEPFIRHYKGAEKEVL